MDIENTQELAGENKGSLLENLCEEYRTNNRIPSDLFDK